ncbi:MAG TPA: hypothetical protein RMH85_11445 [Polyangiaceae bacterium LLY-WYZ-15_(1-7)]|nr:hypothetical protein [Sandaracinus sp.]HJK91810.1 hypothetical protein [Polyangiaceae bacterium LLY-WYZ-15_(1-7)]MBJ75100.1 hypothetical protein [Sandaracinus sp.]HJL06739.1 hypothetical protein [Polyangiaceae bacterium LLY-WYZ-15_(1-7)]HJL09110.1 hypothetical protein [Polyangiaceae bacterium LLY-WYZ-15_(1-7)]
MPTRAPLLLAAALLTLSACGAPQARHVRFAHATATQLQALQDEEVVWYDFQPGDEVPMVFGLLGVASAGTGDGPIPMVARRPFSIVVFRDGRTRMSFDGEHLWGGDFGKWGVVLHPNEATGRGELGLLLFMGRPQDMPEELRGR